MADEKVTQSLVAAVADLDEVAALDTVKGRLGAGDNPLTIIDECEQGMRMVGERYERREYFLSGLIMAGEIFRQVMELAAARGLDPARPRGLKKITSSRWPASPTSPPFLTVSRV